MGCQNGKTTNLSVKSRKEMARNLIEEIIALQKNILAANMCYQVQNTINANKRASFDKLNENMKNLTNSLKTNDNSLNLDLNTAFIEKMKTLQIEGKNLITKAAFYLKNQDEKTTQSVLFVTLKQKIGCLYEFAFKLQLDQSSTASVEELPEKENLRELGDLCESLIMD